MSIIGKVGSKSVDTVDQHQFLNRLRILRSIDHYEVPMIGSWSKFRDDPYEYLISCSPLEAGHIWDAIVKREGHCG